MLVFEPIYEEENLSPFTTKFLTKFLEEVDPVSKMDSAYVSNPFPLCDIYEEENNLVYELALAGYKAEEIKVSFHEDYLIVTGTKEEKEKTEKKRNYGQKSIKLKDFTSKYYVPRAKYDVNNGKADFKDGLLTITIPQNEESKPIDIKVN